MTEPEPTIESLLGKVVTGTSQVIQFVRKRFLWTWAAISLLAILTCISLLLATRTAETNLQQTDDIARVSAETADAAKQQSDDTVAYLKGEQGIPGVPGANGQDGTPGQPSSEPGPPGAPGRNGSDGEPGAPGAGGTQGSSGLSGATGPMGPVGIAGGNGNDGAPGTPGTQGHIGEQGPVGPAGPKGDPGPAGPAGASGPAGPQGEPGSAGTITTVIAVGASASDTTAHKQVTATCASGRASGGGFAIVPADPGIIPSASSPVGNTGWSATADVLSLPAGTNWQLLAFVTCVSAQ